MELPERHATILPQARDRRSKGALLQKRSVFVPTFNFQAEFFYFGIEGVCSEYFGIEGLFRNLGGSHNMRGRSRLGAYG